MASGSLPVRLIICIDGTYCTADGPHGKGHGNISNVYRICASIKTGKCFDPVTGREIIQEKKYEAGIGSADDAWSLRRLKSGVSGAGYQETIRQVYESCCLLGSQDEVWLYGFSRGAYIARAVAGLLDYIGAIKSAGGPQFEAEYAKGLKVYGNSEKRSRIGPGQFHSFTSLSTKEKPIIEFIGAFDTVKAVDDDQLHDISFNDSIQHLRHALALNEDRKAMTPEYVYPDLGKLHAQRSNRSIIQAWFVGAHIDMGGSAKRDGLALYPLQWMLLESKSKGLVLKISQEFDDQSPIQNPLQVVFPEDEGDGRGKDQWSCTTENGVEVWMQDLRSVHELQKHKNRYVVEVNRTGQWWPKETREPFNRDGALRGYCSFDAQGTIVHPSVYNLLDEYMSISLNNKVWNCQAQIENWRAKCLGESNKLKCLGENSKLLNQGFWNDKEGVTIDDVKVLRILVCGNTGAGKSTLINLIFGVDFGEDVTDISDRNRGIHNIEVELIHKNRPDLIVHDSGGFEAGDVSQIQAVQSFVKQKASQTQLGDRLHVIWFCIDMSSCRTKQTATEDLFKAVSKDAADIPLIVVATKKDNFAASQFQEARNVLASPDMTRCDEWAADQVKNRMAVMESEMREVNGGRFDACVAISRNDVQSIDNLNQVTLKSFNHEKVRLVYAAAQVASIDLKIDCAIIEIMRIYRKVLGAASGAGLLPAAPSANRTAAAISICKAVLKSFGLSTVSANTVYQIVRCNIWDDLAHNLSIAFAEGISAVGLVGTVGTAGMPFFLAAGALNFPLVVPATTRLMLLLAGDLILILARAFEKTTLTCVGQPLEQDVERAAIDYRPISSKVHKEILKLVPRRNMIKSFRYNKVRLGLEETVHSFKRQVMENMGDLEPESIGIRPNPSRSADASEISTDIKEMENDILQSYKKWVDIAGSKGSSEALKAHDL